jgi:hypothetical protein
MVFERISILSEKELKSEFPVPIPKAFGTGSGEKNERKCSFLPINYNLRSLFFIPINLSAGLYK